MAGNIAPQNILFLDIETVSAKSGYQELDDDWQALWNKKAAHLGQNEMKSAEALYYEKAGIFAEFGKIIAIAVGLIHTDEDNNNQIRIKCYYGHEENALLADFGTMIQQGFDPSKLYLCAHNGKEFDFPYISRRMLVNSISLPAVLDTGGKKPWEVHHLDTMELWKFGDRKNFTSLDLLAKLFGIKSSKTEDIDGSMVNHVYYEENDIEKIAKYCQRDVAVLAQLYMKLNGLPLVAENNITFL